MAIDCLPSIHEVLHLIFCTGRMGWGGWEVGVRGGVMETKSRNGIKEHSRN